MAKVGMDVEIVKGIGRDLQTQAGAIEQAMKAIGTLLHKADENWAGHDAEEFKNLWNSKYLGQLRTIVSEIQDLGQKAITNANKQDEVSRQL